MYISAAKASSASATAAIVHRGSREAGAGPSSTGVSLGAPRVAGRRARPGSIRAICPAAERPGARRESSRSQASAFPARACARAPSCAAASSGCHDARRTASSPSPSLQRHVGSDEDGDPGACERPCARSPGLAEQERGVSGRARARGPRPRTVRAARRRRARAAPPGRRLGGAVRAAEAGQHGRPRGLERAGARPRRARRAARPPVAGRGQSGHATRATRRAHGELRVERQHDVDGRLDGRARIEIDEPRAEQRPRAPRRAARARPPRPRRRPGAGASASVKPRGTDAARCPTGVQGRRPVRPPTRTSSASSTLEAGLAESRS